MTKPAGDVSIPVELSKTVRADKVHRGDPVEFTTLEAILIGPKLVMPAHSKLFGRVVGAAPRQGDKPSWLVLLVERADWKDHSIPLHAFISSPITLVSAPVQNIAPPSTTNTRSTLPQTGRRGLHPPPQADMSLSSLTSPPQDTSAPSEVKARAVALKDIRMVRDKDGICYLFSTKSNVKLSGGTFFMLQNYPATASH